MEVHVHIHHHGSTHEDDHFARIFSLLNIIRMDQKQLANELAALKEQTEKSNTEIVDKIAALEQAIVDAGTVSPSVEAALLDLKASVQTVDDIVPDAPAV